MKYFFLMIYFLFSYIWWYIWVSKYNNDVHNLFVFKCRALLHFAFSARTHVYFESKLQPLALCLLTFLWNLCLFIQLYELTLVWMYSVLSITCSTHCTWTIYTNKSAPWLKLQPFLYNLYVILVCTSNTTGLLNYWIYP